MANEIELLIALSRVDTAALVNAHTFPAYRWSLDQTLKRHVDQIYSIGTTEENVTFPDITTNGILLMLNLSSSNYVEWGTTTADYPGKMLAGEPAGPWRLNAGKSLYLKANTAACDVRIILYGG